MDHAFALTTAALGFVPLGRFGRYSLKDALGRFGRYVTQGRW